MRPADRPQRLAVRRHLYSFFSLSNMKSLRVWITRAPASAAVSLASIDHHWAMTSLNALSQSGGTSRQLTAAVPLTRMPGTITEALQPLIENGKLRIPRGGYILRRGRGRIERPEAYIRSATAEAKASVLMIGEVQRTSAHAATGNRHQ
jgi:hypothetical protein